MAPQHNYGSISKAHAAADDIDLETKWWNDYPTSTYIERARPSSVFQSYISSVWNKPKQLARSASYTSLTYIKDAVHDYPIQKSTSISSLAPSLALPIHCRQAERIVTTAQVYKPHTYDWYSKSYNRAKWIDLHESIAKPLVRKYDPPLPYSAHVPYYTFQTQKIFFDKRMNQRQSYIDGSKKYLNRYISARLKADDFAQHYAYTAFDWHRPQDHSFNRHFMFGERVVTPHAPRIPHSYSSAQNLRRLYVTTGRFRFA